MTEHVIYWLDSIINSEHSERPESSSERVKIAWLDVRKLIPSALRALRTNFRIRPLSYGGGTALFDALSFYPFIIKHA